MSEQNKAVALRFLETMGSNDPEGAAATLAPGAVTVTMGTGHFSGPRSADNVAGAIEAFKVLMPTGLRLVPQTVTAEADRVVIEATGNAETSAGTIYANNYVFAFTLKDGKITRINEYFCTKLADEVLWPLAQKMQALAI
jgi:ketosteroid isomerase-like protein